MATAWAGSATLSPSVTLTSIPESLFTLLQTLMDAEISDPIARRDAIEHLVAYYCATISNDKYTAVVNANHVHRQVLLMLDSAWNVFGPGGIPVHTPPANEFHDTMAKITSKRAGAGLNVLPGPT
jgi:hypothetical protein